MIFAIDLSTSALVEAPKIRNPAKNPNIGIPILNVGFIFPPLFILSKIGGIKNAPAIRNKNAAIIEDEKVINANKKHTIPKIHFNTIIF